MNVHFGGRHQNFDTIPVELRTRRDTPIFANKSVGMNAQALDFFVRKILVCHGLVWVSLSARPTAKPPVGDWP